MDPIRIKLYGLLPMTRRRYVTQLVMTFFLAVAVVGGWAIVWPPMRHHLQEADAPAAQRFVALWNALPWIILGGAVLQAIEAFIVLRMFRRKEAALSPSPPPPSPTG